MFLPKYDNSKENGSSHTEEKYGIPSFSLIPSLGLLVLIHGSVKHNIAGYRCFSMY